MQTYISIVIYLAIKYADAHSHSRSANTNTMEAFFRVQFSMELPHTH